MSHNKNSRTKNTFLNLLTGFAAQGLNIILRFVTRTFFIDILGKEYLGISGLFLGILSMLSLTELGFGTAISYRLFKPISENDEKRVRILLNFYKQAYRVIGFVIAVLGIMVIPMFPVLIREYDRLEVLQINAVLIFCMFLFQSVSSYLFFAYMSSVISVQQKEYILNATEMVTSVITNIVQILIIILTKNFILYTASAIIISILKNVFNATVARRMYPQFFVREKEKLSREEITDLFKDCGAAFFYKINGVILKATDNLVLSSFIGLAIVGVYSNYLLIYTTVTGLLSKFYQACRASLGNLFAVSDTRQKFFYFEIMNFITAVLFGTAAVGIAVVSDEIIIQWIGQTYLIKQPFAIIIAVEVMFYGLKYNLGQIRNISGVFKQLWYRPVIGALINLVVSVVLVQFIGIYGVITGTAVSDIFSNFLLEPSVLYKYSFDGYKPVSTYYKKNITYLFVLVVTGSVDYFICSALFTGHGIVSLVIHICICGISVPAVFTAIYHDTDIYCYLLEKIKQLVTKKEKI